MTRSAEAPMRRLLAALPLLGVLLWTLGFGALPAELAQASGIRDDHASRGEVPGEFPGLKLEDSEALELAEDERDPESEHRRGSGARLAGVEISIVRARGAGGAHHASDERAALAPLTGGGCIRGPPGCAKRHVPSNMS